MFTFFLLTLVSFSQISILFNCSISHSQNQLAVTYRHLQPGRLEKASFTMYAANFLLFPHNMLILLLENPPFCLPLYFKACPYFVH
ncbi:hypothetical protein F5X97DRAFT_297873 [Nemania serpens]|nr:hypothetical protein F5X97DRAFT_297873 [Nemania serpens]